MGNDETNAEGEEPKYDLEERTAVFGEQVVFFARRVKLDDVTRPIVSQMVRSGTSVGANYIEANDADSRKDFKYRIGVCRWEAKETRHHVRMLVAACPDLRELAVPVWKEATELNLIFGKIRRSLGG